MRCQLRRHLAGASLGVAVAAAGALAQTTLDGTVTNATGSGAVTNPTVSFWLNEKTNWVAGADDAADGWTVEHTQGNAAGAYSRLFNPSPTNVDMAFLSVGFQRGYAKLDPPTPVTTQTRDVGLTSGVLRIELETDADVTCQEHGYGGRPQINTDGSASNGRHLTLVHYWTHMKVPLYFPRAAEYNFIVRYLTKGSAAIYLLPSGWHPPLRTWPATAGSWVVSTNTYLIDTAGWCPDFALRAQNLGYAMDEYIDYLEITEGDPLVSATVTGTVTSGGSPVPYPEVVGIRDNSTNWPGSVFPIDGNASGAYSMSASGVHALDVVALAIGYQRQTTSNVSPVANATRDFILTPGTLRIEADSDPQVIYEAHDEGWRPYIVSDGSASGGKYLQLNHNNTTLRSQLYFAQRGIYSVPLRYESALGGSFQLRLDSQTCFTWPSAAAWSVSNATFTVNSIGWHTLDVYATGIVKGDTNAGIDYFEVALAQAFLSATVTGTVRVAGAPRANVRMAAVLDNASVFPGASDFTNTDAAGFYTFTESASSNVGIVALAPLYRRETQNVSPVADAMRNFELSTGALFVEPATDMAITYQQHSEGYIPSIGLEAQSSQGTYLICAHNWTQARAQLYFPKTQDYRFACRYRANTATTQVKIDGGTVWTLPPTALAWRTTNVMIAVSSGWRTLDLYGVGFDKAFPGQEGWDYLRIGDEPSGTVVLLR